MKSYIGAIDQGTTSTRFMVFDKAARVVALAQKEHEQIFPRPGWVEHDALEILRRTREVIAEALAQRNLRAEDLAAIGITNQRETAVVWDRQTGEPIANAIVWQDTRVSEDVARFAAEGGQDRFRAQTGLPLSTYFSALKIQLDTGECRRRARKSFRRRPAVWKYRYVSGVESYRRAGGRSARHRRNQRQPHAALQFADARLGSATAGRI